MAICKHESNLKNYVINVNSSILNEKSTTTSLSGR